MAEAAKIVQILNLSELILSSCFEYIDKTGQAPKEIQNTTDQTDSIKSLLERLGDIAENPESDHFLVLKSLKRKDGALEACNSALMELSEGQKKSKDASDVKRGLMWPHEAKSIEKILTSLEKLMRELYAALAEHTALQSNAMRETVNEMKDTGLDMKAVEASSSTSLESATLKRSSDICQWLLNSPDFESWVNSPGKGQLLWLNGKPGAGKTVLSSGLVDYLASKSNTKPRSMSLLLFR